MDMMMCWCVVFTGVLWFCGGLPYLRKVGLPVVATASRGLHQAASRNAVGVVGGLHANETVALLHHDPWIFISY